jgi:hypothetical protein
MYLIMILLFSHVLMVAYGIFCDFLTICKFSLVDIMDFFIILVAVAYIILVAVTFIILVVGIFRNPIVLPFSGWLRLLRENLSIWVLLGMALSIFHIFSNRPNGHQ